MNNTQNISDQLAYVLLTLCVINTFWDGPGQSIHHCVDEKYSKLSKVFFSVARHNVQIWQLVRFRQIIRPRVDNEINFFYTVRWPKSKLFGII